MSQMSGGRCRPLPGGLMLLNGRRRSPRCRRTKQRAIGSEIFESEMLRETVLAPPRAEPAVDEDVSEPTANAATQDNSPGDAPGLSSAGVSEDNESPVSAPATRAEVSNSAPRSEHFPAQPAPLFRSRHDIARTANARIPAVIPIVRAPDDPGIDEEIPDDEFAELTHPAQGQASGWRGFLSRWGG